MLKEFCDICERPMQGIDEYNEYKIKVKKKWYSWHESGWNKLLICGECKQKIFGFGKMKSSYAKGYEDGYNQCELDWQRKMSEVDI